MRVLGVTQGASVRVFARIVDMLADSVDDVRAAAYVADSLAYKTNARLEPRLGDGSMALLREWDVLAKGRRRSPEWAALQRWENEIGDPCLWNVLLADRRIFFGPRCKFRQDYRPRFKHGQMGGILLEAIEQISMFIDEQQPDVIVGFGTATFGDYLFFLFAKARGIPYLSLKATKIGNYVSLNDDAIALSDHVKKVFESADGPSPSAIDTARRYMISIRKKGVRYEGALKSTVRFRLFKGAIALARGCARDMRNQLDDEIRRDNHVESATRHAWHTYFLQPLAGLWVRSRLGREWIDTATIAQQGEFAFFPLHFEPEVSLQVFGRPYQNQIELVRNLALSLPPGMVVLVKEHPRSIGFRPLGYYRKLLEIPNVRLVDPELSTHAVIRHAALVAVISGSTGLEAAICGKPVLTFGVPTYNVLSGAQLRHVANLHELADVVRELMASKDDATELIERFLAAHVDGAVPVDLYSVLLGKPGRHSEGREGMSIEQKQSEDYEMLASYFSRRLSEAARG